MLLQCGEQETGTLDCVREIVPEFPGADEGDCLMAVGEVRRIIEKCSYGEEVGRRAPGSYRVLKRSGGHDFYCCPRGEIKAGKIN